MKDYVRQRFLKDVEGHTVMRTFRADGVNRHLRFSAPDSGNYRFDIITWPWHLCITGDMGTYVFSRLEDMFEFHRGRGDGLDFDAGYWAEKVLAMDRHRKIREYSEERFIQAVKDLVEWDKLNDEARLDVENSVLSYGSDGEHAARDAVLNFSMEGISFDDFWEVDLQEYTNPFLWCCFAIAWAIRRYDESRGAEVCESRPCPQTPEPENKLSRSRDA